MTTMLTRSLAFAATLMMLGCGSGPRQQFKPTGAISLPAALAGQVAKLDRRATPDIREGRIWHGRPVREGRPERLYAYDVRMLNNVDVAMLRYVYPSVARGEQAWSGELLGSILHIGGRVKTERRGQELQKAGLTPTQPFAVWGAELQSARLRGPADPAGGVLFGTSKSNQYVLYSGGQPIAHFDVIDERFWSEQPGFLRWQDYAKRLEELGENPQSGEALRNALKALRGNGGLDSRIASLEKSMLQVVAQADERLWRTIDTQRQAWEKRYQAAAPAPSYEMLVRVSELLAPVRRKDLSLPVQAQAWLERICKEWPKRARERWAPEQMPLSAQAVIRACETGLHRIKTKLPTTKTALEQTQYARQMIATFDKVIAKRARAPFSQILLRLGVLVPIDRLHRNQRFIDVAVAYKDLENYAEAQRKNKDHRYHNDLVDAAVKSLSETRFVQNRREAVERMRAIVRLESLPRASNLSIEVVMRSLFVLRKEFKRLERKRKNDPAVFQEPWRYIAMALSAQRKLRHGKELALLNAWIDTLVEEKSIATVEHGLPVIQAAGRLRVTGSVDQQIAAYDRFGRTNWQQTTLASQVARQLSVPLGRRLATNAAALEKKGELGRAAREYYRAASIGQLRHPAPVRSSGLRLSASMRRIVPTQDRDLPRYWLERARLLGARALGECYPRIAPDDPARELQQRYLMHQLAGTTSLASELGLRMSGLSDGTGFPGDPAYRLVQDGDGKILWRPESSKLSPVDLDKWKIDAAGWTRLRSLRAKLDQRREDVEAARLATNAGLPELQARKSKLTQDINTLAAQVKQGAIPIAAARPRIDQLKREENALNSAIRNFNNRRQHFESMRLDFNKQVKVHNDLLFELQKELRVAFDKLLRPALSEHFYARLSKSKLPSEEQAARRWLHGLIPSPKLRLPVREVHPSSLAWLVRDCYSPEQAAKQLLQRELASRLRLHGRGISPEVHLRRMSPAFDAFVGSYGNAEFAKRLWTGLLGKNEAWLNAAIQDCDADRKKGIRKACGL
jgi:hypothetical protein